MYKQFQSLCIFFPHFLYRSSLLSFQFSNWDMDRLFDIWVCCMVCQLFGSLSKSWKVKFVIHTDKSICGVHICIINTAISHTQCTHLRFLRDWESVHFLEIEIVFYFRGLSICKIYLIRLKLDWETESYFKVKDESKYSILESSWTW